MTHYTLLLISSTSPGSDGTCETRRDAIHRMERAVGEYYVSGIKTNISFFREILADPLFQDGQLHTGFIEEFFQRRPAKPDPDPEVVRVAALVAAIHSGRRQDATNSTAPSASSQWRASGRDALLR